MQNNHTEILNQSLSDQTNLFSEALETSQLSRTERRQILKLMDRDVNTTHDYIAQSIDEKAIIILLRQKGNFKIRGFTTLLHTEDDLSEASILFSERNTLHPNIRDASTLHKKALDIALALQASIKRRSPTLPVYWIYSASNVKTYLFLATYFERVYPISDQSTPIAIKSLVDLYGSTYFGSRYDAQTSIIKGPARPSQDIVLPAQDYRYHPQTEIQKAYTRLNPDHDKGDALLCIAELEPANLKSAPLSG